MRRQRNEDDRSESSSLQDKEPVKNKVADLKDSPRTKAEVTPTDLGMLRSGDSYYPSKDENQLADASMDNVDFEGDPLNEKGFGITVQTGKDLDVSGSEEIEEEDGENNDQLEERNT